MESRRLGRTGLAVTPLCMGGHAGWPVAGPVQPAGGRLLHWKFRQGQPLPNSKRAEGRKRAMTES